MVDGLVCDACGETLLLESDVRYVVDIRGFAAYDPLELTRDDLKADFGREVERLLESLEGADAERLEDQIHKEFRFDLCPRCWQRFLKDPLGSLRRSPREHHRPPPQAPPDADL